jgi:hypothetical protein
LFLCFSGDGYIQLNGGTEIKYFEPPTQISGSYDLIGNITTNSSNVTTGEYYTGFSDDGYTQMESRDNYILKYATYIASRRKLKQDVGICEANVYENVRPDEPCTCKSPGDVDNNCLVISFYTI